MPKFVKKYGGTATVYKRERGNDYLIYLPPEISDMPEVRKTLDEAEKLIESCGISLKEK